MAKQQMKNGSTNKAALFLGAGCLVLGIGAIGGVAYTVMAQEETSAKVDALTENVSALVTLQQQQGDPAEAAKAAINAHFEAERMQKRDALLKSAPAAQDEGVPDGKHLYGNPDARFTLVEFSDYECPYCQRFHDTPKEIVESSGDNVNWEYLHFPLDSHNPTAMNLSVASECVSEELGNQAFWAFTNEVFETSGGNGRGVPDMEGLVESLGMSPADLSACMSDPDMVQRVQADMEKAGQAGVTGTPSSYIVDNETGDIEVISGAQPIENVMQKLRALVERSRSGETGQPEDAAQADTVAGDEAS